MEPSNDNVPPTSLGPTEEAPDRTAPAAAPSDAADIQALLQQIFAILRDLSARPAIATQPSSETNDGARAQPTTGEPRDAAQDRVEPNSGSPEPPAAPPVSAEPDESSPEPQLAESGGRSETQAVAIQMIFPMLASLSRQCDQIIDALGRLQDAIDAMARQTVVGVVGP